MQIQNLLSQLKSAMAARNRAAVNGAIQALVDAAAPLGKQWRAIATVAQHNGECRLANEAMALYVEAEGSDPAALFEQAGVLAQTGRLEAARSLLEGVEENVPDRLANAYLKGTVATNLGRLDEARDWLHIAVDARDHSGQAWLALTALGMSHDEPYADRLLAFQPSAFSSRLDEAAFHYARGSVLHERQNFHAAFEAFSAGAEACRAHRPYNLAADQADTAPAIKNFDRAYFAGIKRGGPEGTRRTIFVTGLPRSGTTLVEQILASHSAVDGGEELGLFRLIEQDVGGRGRAALDDYVSGGGRIDRLRALYDHLVRERVPGEGIVIDKTLSASRYFGLAATVCPDAPIVWVRRDRDDCAWSCFRTFFVQGLSWSYDPAAIAAHFALEERLFDHWQDVLGDRIKVVDYRELVTDAETVIADLLTHCGLEWEPAVLTPHKTERQVATASVAQVRQPIGKMGLGAAEPYRAWFDIDRAGAEAELPRHGEAVRF